MNSTHRVICQVASQATVPGQNDRIHGAQHRTTRAHAPRNDLPVADSTILSSLGESISAKMLANAREKDAQPERHTAATIRFSSVRRRKSTVLISKTPRPRKASAESNAAAARDARHPAAPWRMRSTQRATKSASHSALKVLDQASSSGKPTRAETARTASRTPRAGMEE